MSKNKVSKVSGVSYPALRFEQNGKEFFVTSIPIDDLFKYVRVSTRDEDPKLGFQRNLDPKRAKDIAEYLTNGEGLIPGVVALSAQPEAEFSYSSSSKSISFARIEGAFLCLDGQHRLGGYEEASVRLRVPVSIVVGLDRRLEAKIFSDINHFQKGVPAALLADIKNLAGNESAREASLRAIYDHLLETKFAEWLSQTGTARNRISRLTFNRALGPALTGGAIAGFDEDGRIRLVRSYLGAWSLALGDRNDVLAKASFLGAAFAILDEVVRATKAAGRGLKAKDLQETVAPLAALDYTGATTRNVIIDLMTTTLRGTVKISKDDL